MGKKTKMRKKRKRFLMHLIASIDLLFAILTKDEEKEEEISDAPNSLNRPAFCNIDERMNEENNVNTDDDYSDSDFVPLAELVRRENVNKFIWKSTFSTCIVPQQFCESVGPCNLPDDADTPVEVFLCLFPDSLLEHVVYQTKLYATQINTQHGRPFRPTNLNKMKMFFAINIMMGIKHLPSYRDFWSSKPELRDTYTGCPTRNFKAFV
ncbi:Transposase IS4 [Popillia japonica]|uniref:Transposase IS4 n=1 Tax=Popillia japonica TaxID=7064 RepID=A0AAW1LB76_POPJA